MSTLRTKYRNSVKFMQVYAELILAAREKRTVTYQQIAALVGLPTTGSHMAREVGQLLGEISNAEHAAGRPMLSAVAVGVSGIPGDGFFGFARELGNQVADDPSGRRGFWEKERDAVYEVWQQPIRP